MKTKKKNRGQAANLSPRFPQESLYIMQYTGSKLTHTEQKTNNFQFSNRFIAGSGLLEKLTFVQWRVSETVQKHTGNVNVIRLASMLAAFPRMGITAFNFSHNQAAKKFGQLYGIAAPSRKSILNWEHELEKMGFVKIPKHNASKAKVRVFTKEFWELSRHGMPFLSYTSVPVTNHPTYGDKQVIPKDQSVTNNLETEKRAIVLDNKEQPQSRAVSQNKNFERPPKNHKRVPKKLNRFENSIMWWLFQSKILENYREGVILFARFLKICAGDDYCRKLQHNWKDCRDASRPGMVGDLVRYLRSVEDNTTEGGGLENENLCPPLQLAGAFDIPGEEKHDRENPEVKALLASCLHKKPYRGRRPEVLARFNRLDNSQKDLFILNLMDGRIPE